MALHHSSIAMVVVALLALAGLDEAFGEMKKENVESGGVPVPVIPRGQGEACVADTEFMRRNHMTMLRHQRDETMRQGIRSNQYSLRECVACHAVKGPDAVLLTVSSPEHFCRSCHDYAAVKIDCFQCHASRPDADAVASDPGRADDVAAMGAAWQ